MELKKCHGVAGPKTVPSEVRNESPHGRDRRLVEATLNHAVRRFDKVRVGAHVLEPFGDREPSSQLVMLLGCFETRLEGKPLATHSLEREGARLAAQDRAWLQAQLAARRGLWEVLSLERGRSMELVDLLSRHRCVVEEKRGSEQLSAAYRLSDASSASKASCAHCGDEPR